MSNLILRDAGSREFEIVAPLSNKEAAALIKEVGRIFRLDSVDILANDVNNGMQTTIRLVPDDGIVGGIVTGSNLRNED